MKNEFLKKLNDAKSFEELQALVDAEPEAKEMVASILADLDGDKEKKGRAIFLKQLKISTDIANSVMQFVVERSEMVDVNAELTILVSARLMRLNADSILNGEGDMPKETAIEVDKRVGFLMKEMATLTRIDRSGE